MSSGGDRESETRQVLLAALLRAGREHSTATVLFHGAIAARLGLAASDLKTLDLLVRHGPLTAGDVARHTGLATPSVTSLIDRLERRGFVRRRHDTADRRRVIVEPVMEQLAGVDRIFGSVSDTAADLFASFSNEQLEVIRDFLVRSAAWARLATDRLSESAESFNQRADPRILESDDVAP